MICYYLQFIVVYRSFIEPSELFDILKYSSHLLKYRHPTLVKMILRVLSTVLSTYEYKT